MELELSRLVDRQAIVDVTVRYCTALDTKDWMLLASCFTDDALATYDLPDGSVDGPYAGVEAIVDRLDTSMSQLAATQHAVSNHVVDVGDSTARCICYLRAQHVRIGHDGREQFEVGGRYEDDFVRGRDGWRMARRVMTYLWSDPGWSPSGHVRT